MSPFEATSYLLAVDAFAARAGVVGLWDAVVALDRLSEFAAEPPPRDPELGRDLYGSAVGELLLPPASVSPKAREVGKELATSLRRLGSPEEG